VVTFVGFGTYRNVYGVVILTEKDTHIVGNLQVVFDSLFMPFKDKPTTNPRLETLYRVLGRVNDRLKTNSFNNEPYRSRTVTQILRALMMGIPKMREV
jgi:hypothetical protein